MGRKILISKVLRITGFLLLFVTVMFIATAIWLNVCFNKKLVENIKTRVTELTNNEYSLSLDELNINIISNVITVKNISLTPSRKNENNRKAQYVFKAKVFRIINFSIWSYVKDNNLVIEKVNFEEPEISIFQGSERIPNKKLKSLEKKISIYAAFSEKLNAVYIAHIDITNSKFNVFKTGSDTIPVFSSNDNNLSVKNIMINSETEKISRLFFAEKFEVVMNKFSYQFNNGLYCLSGKRIFASYIDSLLTIDSLELTPNFSEKEFAKAAGGQSSRTKIFASKIDCKKMDVKLFFEYNWLIIQKVNIAGGLIEVFRDNTLPLKKVIRPSLQSIIKKLPFFIAVDSIEMKNAKIDFQVLHPGSNVLGKIAVNKVDAIIIGVQNDTAQYLEGQSITATLHGLILNKGRFKQTYKFPLDSTKEFFYCAGSLGPMPMSSFNPLIEQTKHLSIKSGQVDQVSFSFVAHDNTSIGTMKFKYHDLKVEILNEDGEKRGVKEKIKTFLANTLTVYDSNPGKNGDVRTTTIYAKRNPYRFFINYSMLSLLSGIEPAIKIGNRRKR